MIWNSAMWLRNRLVTSCTWWAHWWLCPSLWMRRSEFCPQTGRPEEPWWHLWWTNHMHETDNISSIKSGRVSKFCQSSIILATTSCTGSTAVVSWWWFQMATPSYCAINIHILFWLNTPMYLKEYHSITGFGIFFDSFWSSTKHVQITSRNVKKYNFIYLFICLLQLITYSFTCSLIHLFTY